MYPNQLPIQITNNADVSKDIPNTKGSTTHTRNVALKGAKLIDSRKRKNG